MSGINHETPETRQRLLEAAGAVFAEHGFRAATVREICERARANVAAVNYHFGDKEALYSMAIRHWLGAAIQKYPPDGGLGPEAPAEARLRAFVRSFLFRILDEGRPAWHGRLMAREMADPTPAMDEVIAEFIQPLMKLLHGIVRDLLGPGADDEVVALCSRSVVGQCLFYNHARPVLQKLERATFTPEQIDRLAEHVASFSLAAMKALGGAGGRSAR